MKLRIRTTLQSGLGHCSNVVRTAIARLSLAMGGSPMRISSIFHYPSDMSLVDRLMLYTLVRGLRPNRVLEIGSRWGGSARIMCAALEDNGCGCMVGLDPHTDAFCAPPRSLFNRFTLVKGYSPEDLPKAVEALKGPPDLIFIDALHIRDAAVLDIDAALRVATSDCYVLLHDAFHPGIHAAARIAMERFPDLSDLGIISRSATPSDPVCYQGLRLLRRGAVVTSRDLETCYDLAGVKWPADPEALENYDRFAIRVGLVQSVQGRLQYVKRSDPSSD